MSATLKVPEISDEEHTPEVTAVLEIVQIQQELIQKLRDEIARLKRQKPKPSIKHSTLGKNSRNKDTRARVGRRAKRNKTERLEIHETIVVEAQNIAIGSRFKEYEDFTVQDLLLQPFIEIREFAQRDGSNRNKQFALKRALNCPKPLDRLPL